MRKLSKIHGVVAVEFALIVPFLFAVLFAIIEFGLILYDQQVITNASREGARYGIVLRDPRYTVPEIQGVVTQYCATNLITFATGSTLPDIKVPDWKSAPTFGDNLTVTVQYKYKFLVLPNFVSGLLGIQNLSAKTVMKYE